NLDLLNIFKIAKEMILDFHTITFGLLIGLFNGIIFSYYSEAPGIFIDKFHFTQSQYGFMGCLVASATMIAAWISSKSLKKENAI
ncbi:Bcr/CflA family drug resistance efflux transporter, partial [Bacillus cereus]